MRLVEKEETSLCTGVIEEALQSVINTLKPGKLDPPYGVCTNYQDQEETACSQIALSQKHLFRTPDTTHSYQATLSLTIGRVFFVLVVFFVLFFEWLSKMNKV